MGLQTCVETASGKQRGTLRVCPACDATLETSSWHCGTCGFEARVQDGIVFLAPEFDRLDIGFDSGTFEKLAASEEKHFWFQARLKLIVAAVEQYFAASRRVLEIGCGTGLVTRALSQALPNAEISGSEIFSEGLYFAAPRQPRIHFLQLDARRLPFRNHFDLVGAFDVLEHIEDDRGVLKELGRAMSPGAGLLLTVPQHRWLWSGADEAARHVRRYTRPELLEKLRAAGFEILQWQSFVTLVLPLLYLKRVVARQDQVLDELSISPIANAVLGSVMKLERWLMNAGLRFPWGSSLLVVARKV